MALIETDDRGLGQSGPDLRARPESDTKRPYSLKRSIVKEISVDRKIKPSLGYPGKPGVQLMGSHVTKPDQSQTLKARTL